VLCMPTTPFPAPRKGQRISILDPLRDRITCLCAQGGLAGHPQVNLPGATVDGLPVGLSIIGPRGSDAMLVAQRHVMRSRSGSSIEMRCPLRGAGKGVVGMQSTVPAGSNQAIRLFTSWRINLAQPRSLSGSIDPTTSARATEKASRGLRSSSQSLKVSNASAD
ncbi:MAG: hypothetical protein EB036_13765, partial [Betaproteobacteria bacterium]|nr:hypothetical protein [Betaproteobacteria bacterium]